VLTTYHYITEKKLSHMHHYEMSVLIADN